MNAHQRRKERRKPLAIWDIECFYPFDIMAYRSSTGMTTIFSKPGDPPDTYISALTFYEKEAA